MVMQASRVQRQRLGLREKNELVEIDGGSLTLSTDAVAKALRRLWTVGSPAHTARKQFREKIIAHDVLRAQHGLGAWPLL